MSNEYFSDREFGKKPRIEEQISSEAWGGIVSLIDTLTKNGAFGLAFPDICQNRGITFGTNEQSMTLAARSEIPDLVKWESRSSGWGGYDEEKELFRVDYWPLKHSQKPDTYTILDLIQFCYHRVAKPIQNHWDSYCKHHHLTFDQESGQDIFHQDINRIFSRNGLAYEIQENGQIIRIPPSILGNLFQKANFKTGDSELDLMLTAACNKYLTPNIDVRRESLEKLWDAWERIKTLLPEKDKKSSIIKLFEKASPDEQFREVLNNDANELTRIGNDFQIRHSETNKVPVEASDHIDYLFHRLFSMINLLLKALK